jgi:WD40 repeat protein
MTGNKITGLATTPTDNSDAASKAYVDTKAAVQSVNTKTGAVVLSAGDIAISDTANNFSTDTVQGAIDQLFQSANSGKTAIAGAIGSPATSSDTFSQLATHITNGKQQIADATGNTGVNGSSTFTQLANAVLSLSSPNFGGTPKNVQFDETIAKGDVVESYYRTMSLSSVASLTPAGSANAVTWSPNGLYLAVGHSTSPRLTVYRRSANTFTSVGVPATFGGACNSLNFSSDGDYLAGVATGTGRLRVFKRSGDVFTHLSTGVDFDIPSTGNSCAFSPDTNLLAVGHVLSSSVSLTVYSRSADTFTRLTIADQPTTTVNSVTWSPDGAYLVAGTSADATLLHIWSRSGTTFTKLNSTSVFSSLPTSNVRGVAYSPDGNYLAVALNADPFVAVYKRTGATTYQLLSAPSIKPTGIGNGVSWSPDGAYLTVAHNVNPFFTTYKLKNDVLTNQASPSGLPTTIGNACAWSPNANSLAIVNDGGGATLTVYNNNSTTYLFNKANTDTINPFDKIIGIAKEAGTQGQTKSVDVLVGRSLLP